MQGNGVDLERNPLDYLHNLIHIEQRLQAIHFSSQYRSSVDEIFMFFLQIDENGGLQCQSGQSELTCEGSNSSTCGHRFVPDQNFAP